MHRYIVKTHFGDMLKVWGLARENACDKMNDVSTTTTFTSNIMLTNPLTTNR